MEGRGKYSYRIKMQAVRKARKDAHTGKKAHFFYRISRKEGNKGNKKRRGKEERRQGCRKNNGGKNHPEARRYPHGRRMLSENDRIFQFKPFQNCRKNKKERTERIFRNTLFDQPALSEKTPGKKNKNQHLTYALAFQSKHQGE